MKHPWLLLIGIFGGLLFLPIADVQAFSFNWYVPPSVTIPPTATVHTFEIELSGYPDTYYFDRFVFVPDDIYGTNTGQGHVYKYIVTLKEGWFKYNTLFSLTISDYATAQSINKVFIKMDREPVGVGWNTVSYTWVSRYPMNLHSANMWLSPGTYVFYVGFLNIEHAPAQYTVCMG